MNHGSSNHIVEGVLKTRWFARFARRDGISDASLREAIARAEQGIVDADLGGGLIKQRVARKGQGRSGGYRVLVAFRARGRAVFLYGFAKNERENIGSDDLASLREIAAGWLEADAGVIRAAIDAGELVELDNGEERD